MEEKEFGTEVPQQNFEAKYIFRGLLFAVLFMFLGVYIGNYVPWGIKFLEFFYYVVISVSFIGLVVYTLWECDKRSNIDYEKLLGSKFLPIRFPRAITAFLVLVILVHQGFRLGSKASKVYNQSVVYYKQYDKATQALPGFYDNLYKTYIQTKDITSLAKDAFVEVAKIAMEPRKDGVGVAWKWVHENTQIPYGEFMQFYKDLSDFIKDKREGYYQLEVQRQSIAAQHNMLIDTFPNNLLNNWFLHRKHIEYDYGMLSDSTREIFKTHTENLK